MCSGEQPRSVSADFISNKGVTFDSQKTLCQGKIYIRVDLFGMCFHQDFECQVFSSGAGSAHVIRNSFGESWIGQNIAERTAPQETGSGYACESVKPPQYFLKFTDPI